MFRFKYRIYIILFLFIPVFSTGASGNNKAVGVSSVIHVEDNLLTVKVRNIPLRKVLLEIARQKHIKIDFHASADDPLISNFSSLPMEKGLKKLLRDYSYAFTYGGEYSKGEEHEIRKVVILSNTGESPHRRAEPMITYREETHLYDEPYNEDLGYQEGEDMYDEDLSYQEGEDMYDEGARVIAENLDKGSNVVFLCQGDPFFFGSFSYLYDRLGARYPTEVIPGISSINACAALIGRSIGLLTENIAIVSTGLGLQIWRILLMTTHRDI